MQVSTKWLKDYIDIDLTADELAKKFTLAGIPVENDIHAGKGLEKVVTGRIDELKAHPDSDHLLICQMNIGEENLVQIITGANNVKEGQIVPVALAGANLPCDKKIFKGKMRGVASNGMLCSAGELNIEGDSNGIYILPEDTSIGVPIAKVLGLNDDILKFEPTANHGDCFSVIGLVRELAVLTKKTPYLPEIKFNEDDERNTNDLVKIGISAPDLCARFSSRVLTNVKFTQSPDWMIKRLEGAGIRAINNVVDVTNFVMLEMGQSIYAYDYDKVTGHQLTARRAVRGELLHMLNGTNKLAEGSELVIIGAEKVVGLAGIMGSFESEITKATTTVILEAASFNSVSIRRISRTMGIHSEASGRFERGTNINDTVVALNRAAQLLYEMGACRVCKGVVDVYPNPKSEIKIKFTPVQINQRLGTNYSDKEIINVLKSLGFKIKPLSIIDKFVTATKNISESINSITKSVEIKASYEATVPDWRNDVSLPEDLSEEVARIYGFDNIPSTLPKGNQQGRQSATQNFIDKIKNILSGLGMCEELSFVLTSEAMFDKMRIPVDSELHRAIPIMNPLTDETPLLRTTLLASIFENAARNFNRKNEDIRLFDVAPVFLPKNLPVIELPCEKTTSRWIFNGASRTKRLVTKSHAD